jgi:hypothetical protein
MRDRDLAFRQRPGVANGVVESDPGDPIPVHGFARLQTARISVWWQYRTGYGLRPGRKAAQAVMCCGDLATKG